MDWSTSAMHQRLMAGLFLCCSLVLFALVGGSAVRLAHAAPPQGPQAEVKVARGLVICVGDVNTDSVVDMLDLLILAEAFRQEDAALDLDGADGIVTLQDVMIAAAEFGLSCGGPGTPEATPTSELPATATATPTSEPSPTLSPSPTNAPTTTDLEIQRLEITQAIQNSTNGVSLVAGRQTVVRIYARVVNSSAIDNVTVSLAASRNGSPLGSVSVGPKSISPNPSSGDYATTFNALLPSDWLTGDITLVATVDAANTVPEDNEANNTATTTASFQVVAPLDIKIVPINYTHTPNGRLYPAPTTDSISDWVFRTYPIDEITLSFRAPINFSGDLSNGSSWITLLDLVTALHASDGAPESQVYYGYIPSANGTDEWFSGGTAGIGWIGQRASLGLELPRNTGWPADSAGQLAAHEIGHNLGRRHAPCGGASGVDANYPYSDASIGHYGLDVGRALVWAPGAPDNTKDVMSYCEPVWVSDYTYQALYEDQRRYSLAAAEKAPQPIYLIRAQIVAGGQPTLLPVYALTGQPSQPDTTGEYTLELLDATGQVVAAHPVAVIHAIEKEISAQTIMARVPRPAVPVAEVRLVHDGQVVSRRGMGPRASAAAPQARIVQTAREVTLRWPRTQSPLLVRYTVDDGASWTTVGLDVVAAELTIDTRTLPGGAGRFELLLADQSAPVVQRLALPVPLADTAPTAWITGPQRLPAGTLTFLLGHVADREEGVRLQRQWAINGTPVAGDQSLALDTLTPGNYLISLTTQDRKGGTVTATHQLTITP